MPSRRKPTVRVVAIPVAGTMRGLWIFPVVEAGSRRSGDARRVRLVHGLERGGDLDFDFLDLPSCDWYEGLTGTTHRELSAETGVSVSLLLAIRESRGAARPEPDDPDHEEVLHLVPVVRMFDDVGPVELKGLPRPMPLQLATRAT